MKQQLSEQFSRMKKLAGINENSPIPQSLPPASGEHNPSTLWDSLEISTRIDTLKPIVGPEDAKYLARYSWSNIPGHVANDIDLSNALSPKENTPTSFLNEELEEILSLIKEAEKKAKEEETEEEETEEAPAKDEAPAEEEEETPAEDEASAEDEDVEGEEGLSPEVKKIQSALELAYSKAKTLGDKKLNAQIANTITYFTKTQVLKAEEATGEGETEEVTEDLFFETLKSLAFEGKMSPEEEKIMKGLKKKRSDFAKRYDKDAQDVMHKTAKKLAKNK
jgi:hypothetical protein